MQRKSRYAVLILILLLGVIGLPVSQAGDEVNLAPVTNDEGGPVSITGSVTYTNPLFTDGVAQPIVILEDQAGFVDRNTSFLMPIESQTLGQITSDFFRSPFTYSVTLPEVPRGTYRDVDNDNQTDTGVQIFAIAYWNNTFGDPYLEERDLYGGGWSTAYASTRISGDADTLREVTGGTYLIYAPDDKQEFPSTFGDDNLLFTGDEPVVRLPQGYTLVNMDTSPFTFDRTANAVVNLIEGEGAGTDDFSDMSYTDAFDAMIDKMRREYAFTELKGIDWDAKVAEFRPRFVQADENDDSLTYRRALRDFAQSIPDGHVSGPIVVQDIQRQFSGGIGMAIRQLDDGRVIATFILEDGPADEAGIRQRAEILAINDQPMETFLSATVPPFGPFSSEVNRRLEQLRWAVRFPLESRVDITFRNPDDSAKHTATLSAVSESDSLDFSVITPQLTGFETPVEYQMLDNGYGYVKIYSFNDNSLLTVQLWERMIQTLNNYGTRGLIIDMRQNGGGSGFLAEQMAAYFFDEPLVVGNTGYYDKKRDEFYFDERNVSRFYLPPPEQRYEGDIAVLIGPECFSACEFFTYSMTLENRAAVVGEYPTGGLGGSIQDFFMPEGVRFRFTIGRAVDANGNIHIEGKGVAPTVPVPVTEETLLSKGDPVLEAAVNYLDQP